VKLVSPPVPVSIVNLVLPQWNGILFDDLPLESVLKVSLLIETDATGKLSDVKAQDTNWNAFAERISSLVRKKVVYEVSYDGRPSRSTTTFLLRLYTSKKPIDSKNW
ncbi:MAG: hypothetical protein WC360_04025, partial [Opitutales bacterium]|jgi:hypothetical protein